MEILVRRKSGVILLLLLLILLMPMSVSAENSTEKKPFDPPTDKGRISSFYGPRSLFGRKFHYGIDISIPIGTPLYASEGGTVTISQYKGGYGYLIEIQHEGSLKSYRTRYGHNSRLVAKVGQHVRKGELIAYSGNTGDSTGPHVHYEVRINNSPVNPLPLTNFDGFEHTGVPDLNVFSIKDAIVMGFENLVVISYNEAQEKLMQPLMSGLPVVLKVDLDITKIEIVQQLHRAIVQMAFKLLPFIIFFYIVKMASMNLMGEKAEFVRDILGKFIKTGILMEFSFVIAGIFLGLASAIILFFVKYVDQDFSKIMYGHETIVEFLTGAGIHAVISTITFIIYILLVVVIMIRIMDLALITVLTPLIIPFAEFADRSLYTKLINIYIGIPIAQFATVLCFAFAIGFSEASVPTLQGLGVLGRLIISIASAVYALTHPQQVQRIFQISSIEVIDTLIISAKGMMVIENQMNNDLGEIGE